MAPNILQLNIDKAGILIAGPDPVTAALQKTSGCLSSRIMPLSGNFNLYVDFHPHSFTYSTLISGISAKMRSRLSFQANKKVLLSFFASF